MYVQGIKQVQVLHVSHGIEAFARKKNKPGIYVWMGNRVTQIIGIRDGKTVYLGEIRFGREDYLRVMEESLGMQEVTAYELQEQYAKEKISLPLKQKLHTMLTPQAQQCQGILSKELEHIEAALSSNIFLFGEGGDLPEMKECIEGVKVLTPKDIDEFEAAHGLDDTRFTSLFLLINADL